MRDFQIPGRSAAHSTNVMVATSHPLASATALRMLASGGNAVDAAIAAAAVLGVVEPEQAGIGGDCFALICPRGGSEVIALDGSGTAPQAATADWYLKRGMHAIPFDGPHSVTIPGAVDAWARLAADYGTKKFGELLAPAIAFAEEGHPVHARVAADWAQCVDLLGKDPALRAIFLPHGLPPRVGDVFRQPMLAATLREISRKGRNGFYRGPIAERMANHLRSLGGLHTAEDFAGYSSRYVRPVRTRYRGFDVLQCPPAGQGLTALIMLNVLGGLDLPSADPLAAERLHALIEVAKIAYRERDRWVGDSGASIDTLLSPSHTALLAGEIVPARVADSAALPGQGSDTIYLTVVDRERTVISLIASIYKSFGSGLACPHSGVVLQNRAAGFVIRPGHPNCIGPGKRPLHTIMPGLALHEGRPAFAFGTVGGDYQPTGNVWLLANMIDFGLDPQAAIDLPRLFAYGGEVKAETGFPMQTLKQLTSWGHRVIPAPLPLGSAQAIAIDWQRGILTGGSDGRTDGCAIGF